MTHLSDFSYLARSISWVYILVYLGHSMWRCDRFKCMRFKSIFQGELKSIITLLIILTIGLQLMWDIVSCYMKYTEGYMTYLDKAGNQQITAIPFHLWQKKHVDVMVVMDYVACCTFSLQISVFFLMQTFWNYLSNRVAKRSFMGSFEFKTYIVLACLSVVIFPILQYTYRNDPGKREAIPQLAFGSEGFAVSLLGIRSHLRFKRIISISQRNGHSGNKSIVSKLSYFKDMNTLLSLMLGLFSVSMMILCIDGLTVDKVINHSKFAADILIANVNMSTCLLYLLLVSIFHPRPQYLSHSDDGTTSGNESNYQLSNTKAPEGDNMGRSVFSVNAESDIKYNSNTNQNNGGFMRTMSPVQVDYPHSMGNDTMPLTSNAAPSSRAFSPADPKQSYSKSNNVAVEDPYNCEPVMFTMVDIANKKPTAQRYAPSSPTSVSSQSTSPKNIQNRVMSPPLRKYNDDDSYDMSYTTDQTRYRQPSWDRKDDQRSPPTSPIAPNNGSGKQVNDWLWQSPDRRNP